ncbi:hypothetical protein [Haloquadratum walsbyi]|uniref:C2H2-type domain-containing protein n=1 Tax=Haloquadratum walsbyi J07HQW2 TaxID=1238425 RepID=U1PUI7_9EURY|nr:hypothetical protein [Haloquadratum walsbyi]ERG96041.1 MAG: hypothetical protein J07HQW2_02508 [Haloquadratum walsbyi J07HQW2]
MIETTEETNAESTIACDACGNEFHSAKAAKQHMYDVGLLR